MKVEEVTGDDGMPDLLVTLDRNKIMSVGKPALGKFLQRLQVMFLEMASFFWLTDLNGITPQIF